MSRSGSIGSYSERTTCPQCGKKIRLEDVRVIAKPPFPKCQACGTPIRVSHLYRRLVVGISLALSCLIPYLIGFRTYIAIAWIPFSFLAFMLVPNLAKGIVPPRLERYTDSVPQKGVLRRNMQLFFSLWSYFAFGALVVILGVERWVFSLLGASKGELRGTFDLVSEPLCEVNGAFRIGPDTSFSIICGIVLANTFLYAVVMFPVSKIIRASLHRNRVTRLGLNSTNRDQDDEEDET